jgi:ABC-type transport system involved in multi-copper enzyme maturation permease subunit
MFLKLLAIEHKKNFRRWTLRIEVTLLCILLSFVYLMAVIRYAHSVSDQNPRWIEEEKALITWPYFLGFSTSLNSTFGFVLVIILVGGLAAQEYSSRTISLQVGHGAPRLLFLPAKFVGFLLPIFVLVLSPVVYGAAISFIPTVALNNGVDFFQADFRHLAEAVIGITYSLLPCAAFTFLLAVLTRSAAAAIGIGMGYFLAAENLLFVILWSSQGTYAEIAKFLPGQLSGNLTTIIEGGTNSLMGSSPPSLEATIIGIAAYTVVFFLIALVIFRRQDLSAG